ncbi:antA/AntB antirepressor family protein [Actinobacillus sp. GY-402]|nr:antA/AntB antirepressor family protein [Actinobacillus sp. GY-402]
MTHFNIKTFTGSLQNQPVQLINARDLHQMLQVGRDFSNWIKSRIESYSFVENEDFTCSPNLASEKNKGLASFWGGQNKIDYHITLDMAKELCMLERSELGQQARRYFIRMEKEALQARQTAPALPSANHNAVQLSKDRYIELLENENQLLRTQPNPLRKKAPVPLSAAEKHQILQLAQQGLQTMAIAKQINRSKSAVRAVIRENLSK